MTYKQCKYKFMAYFNTRRKKIIMEEEDREIQKEIRQSLQNQNKQNNKAKEKLIN